MKRYRFLTLILAFLTGTSAFSQPLLRYEYTQFLKTNRMEWYTSGSAGHNEWMVRWISTINRTSGTQLRDEVSTNLSFNQPIADSLIWTRSLQSLSLFTRQAGVFSRSNDWKPSTGMRWIDWGMETTAEGGVWYVDQSGVALAGPSFLLNHTSRPVEMDWVQLDLSVNSWTGSAGKRHLLQQSFSAIAKDPILNLFSIGYSREVNNRDFVSATSGDTWSLDKRLEQKDRLRSEINLPVFDDLITTWFAGNWEVRQIDREAAGASPQNPDYRVTSNAAGTETGMRLTIPNWEFSIKAETGAGNDSYNLLETEGLTGLNESIQETKLKKRNVRSTSIRMTQATIFTMGNWKWEQAVLFSRDQLFNPNNNSLDDRDAGTFGLSQKLVWSQASHKISAGADYQQTHQVFIHQDRSGDNYRNHFIRLNMMSESGDGYRFSNQLEGSVSSQIRIFDFDDFFLIPKSFILRSLSIEDSVTFSLFRQKVAVRAAWNETHQGIYSAKRFTESPVRRLAGRLLEAGWLYTKFLFAGYRWYWQDQDRWNGNTWNLNQSIRQEGFVLRSRLNWQSLVMAADGWLMQQTDLEKETVWYPALNLRIEYRF